MSSDDPVANGRDAELRSAVTRLLAFRKQALSDLRISYDDKQYHWYGSDNARRTLLLMNDPLWHAVEESLK